MTFPKRAIQMLIFGLLLIAPAAAFADSSSDRVQFFQSININADEQVGDIVCLFCSIHMAGTSGDTVAILGNIVVDGTAKGDVVAVGGGVKLGEDATVGGDAVAIGRGLSRHPNATVKGETVSQSGPIVFLALIFALVVVPLLPFILVIRPDCVAGAPKPLPSSGSGGIPAVEPGAKSQTQKTITHARIRSHESVHYITSL